MGGASCEMPATASTEIPASELEIKKILLVDDDVGLAAALKELLEGHNYLVTSAYNGMEALREVMESDFDVIVCDMMMPQMPGDMFYLAVKKTKPELCDRFLFITGHVDNLKIDDFLRTHDGLVVAATSRS